MRGLKRWRRAGGGARRRNAGPARAGAFQAGSGGSPRARAGHRRTTPASWCGAAIIRDGGRASYRAALRAGAPASPAAGPVRGPCRGIRLRSRSGPRAGGRRQRVGGLATAVLHARDGGGGRHVELAVDLPRSPPPPPPPRKMSGGTRKQRDCLCNRDALMERRGVILQQRDVIIYSNGM